MKKLFYFAVLLTAALFTSCGSQNQVQVLADDLQAVHKGYHNEFMRIDRISADGDDIVVDVIVYEDKFMGASFKEIFEEVNADPENVARIFMNYAFEFDQTHRDAYEWLKTIHELKCDIVMRLVGDITGEEVVTVVSHEELPEISLEDVEAFYAKYPNVPELITDYIAEMTLQASGDLDSEFIFNGAKVEDHNIILSYMVNERLLGTDDFVALFEENDVSVERWHDEMLKEFQKAGNPRYQKQLDAIRDNHYNIVLRYWGARSHRAIQLILTYDEL